MKQSKENKTCKERQDDQNWMDITDKVQIGHFLATMDQGSIFGLGSAWWQLNRIMYG